MGFIYQDTISKKLLLVYCIENMRREFEEVGSEIDFKSEEEKFEEITGKIITLSFLRERVKVTVNNIEYLRKRGFIDVNFLESIKKEIECLSQSYECHEDELQKEFDKSKNEYINGKLNIEKYLKKRKDIFIHIIDLCENYMYCENKLVKKIIEIWNGELTDCDTYKKGDKFKFLVYATNKSADFVYNNVLYGNAVIHTSYITNEYTMTYQERDYGLVYGIDEENLLFMSDSDNMTVDEEIQLENFKFSLDKCFFFRENYIIGVSQLGHNIARTYLPEQLLCDNYNEVDLANNKYTIPKAVFVFEDAKEFGREESKKLAEKLKLKLLILQRKTVSTCRK